MLVQQRVDDLRAEVAHADVVDIGEAEAHAGLDLVALDDGLVLAAEIPHRLGDAIDEVRIDVAHDGVGGIADRFDPAGSYCRVLGMHRLALVFVLVAGCSKSDKAPEAKDPMAPPAEPKKEKE